MENNVVIDVDKQRKQADKLAFERQEIVREIVNKIDDFILNESTDGSVEETEKFTQRAVMDLQIVVYNLKNGKKDLFINTDYGLFDQVINAITIKNLKSVGIEKPEVVEGLLVDVIKQFVEKATIPLKDRLREFDRTGYSNRE